MLADLPLNIVGLSDVGLTSLQVDETGDTFLKNASLKARGYAHAGQRVALADDSGLVVDALDGAPGVHSARYGGVGLDDAGRRAHLLAQLAHVPEQARTARFVCVIAVHDWRDGKTITVEGKCEGRILMEERDGGQGFGYDALFVPAGYDESFAQLPAEVKNSLSHRGVAVTLIRPHLLALIGRAD